MEDRLIQRPQSLSIGEGGKKMIVPVRCFSCGTVVGDCYEKYKERVLRGESPEGVLDDLGVRKYCCRRMVFSHVDFMDEILKHRGVK